MYTEISVINNINVAQKKCVQDNNMLTYRGTKINETTKT